MHPFICSISLFPQNKARHAWWRSLFTLSSASFLHWPCIPHHTRDRLSMRRGNPAIRKYPGDHIYHRICPTHKYRRPIPAAYSYWRLRQTVKVFRKIPVLCVSQRYPQVSSWLLLQKTVPNLLQNKTIRPIHRVCNQPERPQSNCFFCLIQNPGFGFE